VQARAPKTPFTTARSKVGPATAREIARFRIDPDNVIRATSISTPGAMPASLRAAHAGVGLSLAALPAPVPGSEPLLAMVRECRHTGRLTVLTWESAVRPGEMRGARAWPSKRRAGWVWLAVDALTVVAVRKTPRATTVSVVVGLACGAALTRLWTSSVSRLEAMAPAVVARLPGTVEQLAAFSPQLPLG
jgi:hypothetical protein